jgi:hypothetical protein
MSFNKCFQCDLGDDVSGGICTHSPLYKEDSFPHMSLRMSPYPFSPEEEILRKADPRPLFTAAAGAPLAPPLMPSKAASPAAAIVALSASAATSSTKRALGAEVAQGQASTKRPTFDFSVFKPPHSHLLSSSKPVLPPSVAAAASSAYVPPPSVAPLSAAAAASVKSASPSSLLVNPGMKSYQAWTTLKKYLPKVQRVIKPSLIPLKECVEMNSTYFNFTIPSVKCDGWADWEKGDDKKQIDNQGLIHPHIVSAYEQGYLAVYERTEKNDGNDTLAESALKRDAYEKSLIEACKAGGVLEQKRFFIITGFRFPSRYIFYLIKQDYLFEEPKSY